MHFFPRALFGGERWGTQSLLLILTSLLLLPNLTTSDVSTYDVSASGIDPGEMVTRYPILYQIMEEVGGGPLPVPYIMENYPKLWEDFKKDEQVWTFFEKNLPEYTRKRTKVNSNKLEKPFEKNPTAELEYFEFISKILRDYTAFQKKDIVQVHAEVYMKWQECKWKMKNYLRAINMNVDASSHRAWESHAIDRDYIPWFEKYGVEPMSQVSIVVFLSSSSSFFRYI